MEFNMSMVVPTAPAELWNTLIDVARISACIPGCENVEEIERLATYKATVKQKIGPFKVEVPADIVVRSMTEPSHVRTRATGRDKFTGTRLAVVLDVTVTPAEGIGVHVCRGRKGGCAGSPRDHGVRCHQASRRSELRGVRGAA